MTEAPDWHVPDDLLQRYGGGAMAVPLRWSVEGHLESCVACRGRLAQRGDLPSLDRIWQRVDAELDVSPPGLLERLLMAVGVPDNLARLLTATAALRRSWLGAVIAVLTIAVVVAWLAGPTIRPLPLLVVAPLLPVLAVAASFGPRVDPTYEIGLVAPFSTFRLMLLRTSAVLLVTIGLSGAASLAMPPVGLRAAGWLLPSLAMTLLTLALSVRMPVRMAAGAVVLGWAGVMAASANGTGLLTPTGQTTFAVLAASAAVAVIFTRHDFETARLWFPFRSTSERLT